LTDSTVKASMSVEAIANDIVLAGGSAEAAEIDVLDEPAVDKHLQSVIEKVGYRPLESHSGKRIARTRSY
jgi:hypothetical protein